MPEANLLSSCKQKKKLFLFQRVQEILTLQITVLFVIALAFLNAMHTKKRNLKQISSCLYKKFKPSKKRSL